MYYKDRIKRQMQKIYVGDNMRSFKHTSGYLPKINYISPENKKAKRLNGLDSSYHNSIYEIAREANKAYRYIDREKTKGNIPREVMYLINQYFEALYCRIQTEMDYCNEEVGIA